MSLRVSLIHSCFLQSMGHPRPDKCRCKYRVTLEQAKQLVEEGQASWLIVDYKNGEPVTSWNLVWGSKPEEGPETTVRSALAAKTPRVQTIEKAHIARSTDNLMRGADGKWTYKDGKVPDDASRIEVWGELQQQVWKDLIVPFVPDPYGGGRPIIVHFLDERSCVGKDVKSDKISIDITKNIE